MLIVSIPIWCDYKQNKSPKTALEKSFQFQYGAIIREFTGLLKTVKLTFQFQYGAIISNVTPSLSV